MVKYCSDCLHSVPDGKFLLGSENSLRYARCSKVAPSKIGNDYSTTYPGGETGLEFQYCNVARMHSECGPEGKLWEAKETAREPAKDEETGMSEAAPQPAVNAAEPLT